MVLDNELFLYNRKRVLLKFKVVGFIPSPEFQKCRYLVDKLHECYPTIYEKPEIRAMFNLDWDEYLTKMKRRHGKQYYLLQAAVAVYLDGALLGDDKDLVAYIKKKYTLETSINFEDVAEQEIIKYFSDIVEKHKRKFAYLTVAVDEHVVGSMLFVLYNDLVPMTCDNFLIRCNANSKTNGYKGTKVHRVAKYSWVQCGGFDLHHVHMPCENYSVPHDRKGVLSMCNKKRHTRNSTQFYITLEPASWMDYNYVAFGQLIQGAEILNIIEKVSTYYESPTRKIEITNCGEFSLCLAPDEDFIQALKPPYETLFTELFTDQAKGDDIDSLLSETGLKAGKYFLKTDLKPYLPFSRFSKMFDEYMKYTEQELENMNDVRVERALKKIEKEEIEELDSTDVNISIDRAVHQLFQTSRTFYSKHHIVM